MILRQLLIFSVLGSIKTLASIFYRCEYQWVGRQPDKPFEHTRLVALLNHTSLFEPLFFALIPWRILWQMSRHAVIPAADITLERPIVGVLINLLGPKVIPITRKRDASWQNFLNQIDSHAQIWIAPEGRMMRQDGLDKDGCPMTVRGGIADILTGLQKGQMIIAYSGGLHHVQFPGQRLPKVFKRIRMNLEQISIESFKKEAYAREERSRFKLAVIELLEERKRKHLPTSATDDSVE